MTGDPNSPPRKRCAIYTRKSSDEGLDQGFNSLHAQREACEAYVLSQAGEGWTALSEIYDDGGWSGGTMDRPALKRLLTDIGSGLVDVVVVYKVDRLTRSLMDFARIVEALDRDNVSFVSITQAFNTTTSMGRLTLNVLLSFAQFEREVTGERIRDKIAQSKAKGMWMGGVPPFGYDPPTDRATRALVVNTTEAQTVRLIFARYLDLGSVHVLQRWLSSNGVRSKCWTSASGRQVGGAVFSRGALFHLLKNRVYMGEITHKGGSHPGAHVAIIEASIFEAVQASLSGAARRRGERPTRASTALLKGLIFDADGSPMSPTFAHGRGGKIYRYYVSAPLQQGRRCTAGDAIRRAPIEAVDSFVRRWLERIAGSPAGEISEMWIRSTVERVELQPTSVQLLLRRRALFARLSDPHQELATLSRRIGDGQRIDVDPGGQHCFRLTVPMRMKLRGGRTWITTPEGCVAVQASRVSQPLVDALHGAHALLASLSNASVGAPERAVLSRAPDNPYDRKLLRLAFLAPDIQRDILFGRQPAGLTLERLMYGEIPLCWEEQRRRIRT